MTRNGTLVSQYTYDPNGNRLSHWTPDGTDTGSYDDQDRLLAYGDGTYTYTAAGELLTKTDPSGTTTYDNDPLGNLRRVDLPDGTVIEYVIDAQNRRVGRKVNGTLTQGWLYGDQLNPVAETDGAGNIVSRFVYGARSNVPDFMIRGGITYRIISDHLGSVRYVLDPSTGNIMESRDYDEFGNVASASNSAFEPFAFAGGIVDLDTDLTRCATRDLDRFTGRFTTRDPALFGGRSGNLYTYVFSDPINWIDPTGLWGKPMPEGPPPAPVPGDPSNQWKWNPSPKSPRGGSWGPKRPIKGQSQPKASWDNNAETDHWDVDDGFGNRRRYDEEGNELSDEEAHGRRSSCSATQGWDWATIGEAALATLAGVAITVLTGGRLTLQPQAGVVVAPVNPTFEVGPDGHVQCRGCSM